MTNWKPGWMKTGLGSLPMSEPEAATALVLERFPGLPFWPQLPPRSPWENITLQFAAGLPGLIADPEAGTVGVDPTADLAAELTTFYEAYLAGDSNRFALTPEVAPGYFRLGENIQADPGRVERLKGQVIGPLTFCQAAKDAEGRMVLHDPELRIACARGLGLGGAWQVENFPRLGRRPLILIDDPGVYLVGSAHLGLSRAEAIELIAAAAEPIARAGALVGVHCCANTDWSLLLSAEIDVLSLDAAGFGESLLLYADDVIAFLERGGVLAWGIVPTNTFTGRETPESLLGRLGELTAALVRAGADRTAVQDQALLTPACGLGSLSSEVALAVLDLLDATHALLMGR